MSCPVKKTVKDIVIDGKGYTPEGAWTFTFGGRNKERMKYANGSASIKVAYESDVASGQLLFTNITDYNNLVKKDCFDCTFYLEGGEVVQFTDTTVTGHPDFSEGLASLELSGDAQ